MANGTVEALYPYSYEAGDGRVISFSAGDRFTLLSKTNGDWWQVRKGSEKPMYVPATYMKEITIPIYENIEFKITCPQNGEAVARIENGQSSERGDYKNESNGETAIHQDNELENHNRSVNIGTENNGEDTCYILDDTCPVSDDSNGVGSVLSNAKLLARSLEKVRLFYGDLFCDLACLHLAQTLQLIFCVGIVFV